MENQEKQNQRQERILLLLEMFVQPDSPYLSLPEPEKGKVLAEEGLTDIMKKLKSADDKLKKADSEEKWRTVIKERSQITTAIANRLTERLMEYGMNPQLIEEIRPIPEKRYEKIRQQLAEAGMDNKMLNEMTEEKMRKMIEDELPFIQHASHKNLSGTLHAREGIAMDDTEECRKMLDKANLSYIRMAQNKNPNECRKFLFIPFSWQAARSEARNFADKYKNRYLTNLALITLIATVPILGFHPIYAVVVFASFRKLHWFDHQKDQCKISHFQKKSLDKGLTVLAEMKDKKGNTKEYYYYIYHGNLCKMDANSVPIPTQLYGIKLSQADRQMFRNGELVELVGTKGEKVFVRIDLTSPNLCQRYYLPEETKVTDKVKMEKMRTVPSPDSSDQELLAYICEKGTKGITNVYGDDAYNPFRYRFLNKYKLYSDYIQYNTQVREQLDKLDERIKENAIKALSSLNQSNGEGFKRKF